MYLFGTLTNYSLATYLVGLEKWLSVLVFFVGIMANHIFLVKGIAILLDVSDGPKKSKRTAVYLVAKSMVLIAIFIYILQVMPEKIIICTLVYIFQLIILVLSIKKIAYKIKDISNE